VRPLGIGTAPLSKSGLAVVRDFPMPRTTLKLACYPPPPIQAPLAKPSLMRFVSSHLCMPVPQVLRGECRRQRGSAPSLGKHEGPGLWPPGSLPLHQFLVRTGKARSSSRPCEGRRSERPEAVKSGAAGTGATRSPKGEHGEDPPFDRRGRGDILGARRGEAHSERLRPAGPSASAPQARPSQKNFSAKRCPQTCSQPRVENLPF
jgi:hypothetical protein